MGQSAKELETITNILWRDEVVPRLGVYTVSLLYSKELGKAAKDAVGRAGLVSEQRQEATRSQAIAKLNQTMPESLNQPREAAVRGLGKIGSRLCIHLDYPEIMQERKALTDGMDELMGIKHDWMNFVPHASIARRFFDKNLGQYRRISNFEEIERYLPKKLQLSPAQPLGN